MLTSSASLPATIGPYHVEGLLGQGGMARVYRALDPTLQRPVALKLLTPVAAAVPGYADRFLQEARILAQLRHPNIVQVYDFGTHEGTPYMVQELLPGPTLEQRLRDLAAQGQRLSVDEVTSVVSQLAAALDAAHALGVIHRDVKPGNAIWNAASSLVLTDFGIAKQTLGDVHQTQTGIVIGTPAYLSPEQAQGKPLTPASDVYALGVVLYELLAGVVPFPGATPLHVALAHVQAPPPDLAAARPDLPLPVAEVVRQALAKEPGARFPTAGALAAALTQAWAAPPPAPASIHNQPTQVWEGAPAATTGAAIPRPTPAVPPGAPPPAPATGATIAQPAASPAVSHAPSRRRLLPILGGVFVAVFVIGALAAMAGGRGGEVPAAPAAATASTAPTAGIVNTSPPVVTAPPATEPTLVPAPVEEPANSPPPDAGNGNGNGGNGNGNGNGGNGNGNGNGNGGNGNGNGNGKDKKDK